MSGSQVVRPSGLPKAKPSAPQPHPAVQVLPFFPTGTLERVESEGDVATAFTMARILSNIPLSRGGPTSIVIFDIHALQVS